MRQRLTEYRDGVSVFWPRYDHGIGDPDPEPLLPLLLRVARQSTTVIHWLVDTVEGLHTRIIFISCLRTSRTWKSVVALTRALRASWFTRAWTACFRSAISNSGT